MQVAIDMAAARGGLPGLWSAELPRLYWLRLSLLDSSGHLLEAESCGIGFRSVQVRQRQLLINTRPVMIKGVNRCGVSSHICCVPHICRTAVGGTSTS